MSDFKRIISMMLSLIMVLTIFSVMPLSVSAAEEEIARTGATSGTTGSCKWELDGTVLTISGIGKMGNYDYNSWGTDITEVIISDGVTYIGGDAFYGCTKLASVTISDTVTEIGRKAFYNCKSLTSITIPASVTSIDDIVFEGCTSLTGVYINDIGSWCAIKFNYLTHNPLYYAHNLYLNEQLVTDLTIPDSVVGISDYAFYGCTELKSVDIPASVTSIGKEVFSGCTNLTSIKVDSGNSIYDSRGNCNSIIETETNTLISGCQNSVIPDTVTNISSSAFYNCKNLTSVAIPGSVTSIGSYAFEGCSSLTGVYINDIGSWCGITFGNSSANPLNCAHKLYLDGQAVTSLVIPDTVTRIGDYEFYGYTSMTSVTIPDSVTSIGDEAFGECRNLISIVIPDSVTSIGDYAFHGCLDLINIEVPDSVISVGRSAFSSTAWYYSQPAGIVYAGKVVCDILGVCPSDVVIKDGTLGIARYVFQNTGLTSVIIPDTVIHIGDSAFEYCINLESVTIGNSVTYIGDYAFNDCRSLTSIDLPDSVTSIGKQAFERCYNLTSVDIPDSVTSLGNSAFEDCTSLTSVTIGNSITSISDYAFSYCKKLTSVAIGNSVTTIGNFAFNDCTSLTSINIPGSVKTISSFAFSRCTSLTSAYIPDSVTTIGSSAFSGCTSLTSADIPDSVTVIGSYAFDNCKSLISADIPDSVTTIGKYAFCRCQNLASIFIPDSVTSIGINAFAYTKTGFIIYGYKGSVAETYAKNNTLKFIALSKPQIYHDEDTDISVTVAEEVELSVVEITDDEAIGNIQVADGERISRAFDITLTKDGETVQPEGKVTVSIPCEDESAKVYRLGDDEVLINMNARYKDGYLMFVTDHFSIYIVCAEAKIRVLGDADGDGDVSSIDVTYIQRYEALMDVDIDESILMNGDVDNDGKLEIADATWIQRYLVLMRVPYEIGQK